MPRVPVVRARTLRRRMSRAEALLWACLRRNGLAGLHFRRQHPSPPYTLDFDCRTARLAVEVDGVLHTFPEQAARNARRDEVAAERGVFTLRIAAADVMHNLDGVLHQIEQTAQARLRTST